MPRLEEIAAMMFTPSSGDSSQCAPCDVVSKKRFTYEDEDLSIRDMLSERSKNWRDERVAVFGGKRDLKIDMENYTQYGYVLHHVSPVLKTEFGDILCSRGSADEDQYWLCLGKCAVNRYTDVILIVDAAIQIEDATEEAAIKELKELKERLTAVRRIKQDTTVMPMVCYVEGPPAPKYMTLDNYHTYDLKKANWVKVDIPEELKQGIFNANHSEVVFGKVATDVLQRAMEDTEGKPAIALDSEWFWQLNDKVVRYNTTEV